MNLLKQYSIIISRMEAVNERAVPGSESGMPAIMRLPPELLFNIAELCTPRVLLHLSAVSTAFRDFVIPRYLPDRGYRRKRFIREAMLPDMLEEERRQKEAYVARTVEERELRRKPSHGVGPSNSQTRRLPTVHLACLYCIRLLPFYHFETSDYRSHRLPAKKSHYERKCINCRVKNRFFFEILHHKGARSITFRTFFSSTPLTVCVFCNNLFLDSVPCETLLREDKQAQNQPGPHFCQKGYEALADQCWCVCCRDSFSRLRREVTYGSTYQPMNVKPPEIDVGAMCTMPCCVARFLDPREERRVRHCHRHPGKSCESTQAPVFYDFRSMLEVMEKLERTERFDVRPEYPGYNYWDSKGESRITECRFTVTDLGGSVGGPKPKIQVLRLKELYSYINL
ncbi:hypothetical protein BJ508DRAFT_376407 [Ascobolus immersus RN42]|uniref:F-box domain-containing protein n=1 Tax=Ascobolus immersus RN42 TaxID=1160509 RepID=A0A3N4IIL3_ASCIM|nr:hypothetical protein BJ508DRAFT_376407 [Ascobolus immersus RN42]